MEFSKLVENVCYLISENPIAEKQDIIVNLSNSDWEQLIIFLKKNKLVSYFYFFVKKDALLSFLPEIYKARLQQEYHLSSIRNLQIRSIFLQLVKLFADNKIPFIALKGCDIQNRVYQNPVHRNMIDIDLLLFPNDLPKATELLEQMGAKKLMVSEAKFLDRLKHHEEPLIYKNVAIELHKSLVDTYDSTKLGKLDIWNLSEKIKINEQEISVLVPEFLLVYLCHHLQSTLQGGKIKLFWYLDIKLFIERFGEKINKELLYKLLNSSEEETFFFKTLAETKYLFPTVSLPEFLNKFEIKNFDFLVILKALQTEKYVSKPLPHYVEKYFQIENNKDRLLFAIYKLFPAKTYIRNIYKPKNSVTLIYFYLFHFFLTLKKALKAGFYYIYKRIKTLLNM